MSRVGVFRSHNKVGETWSFKVLTWTGKTWTGVIAFEGGNMKLPSQPGTYGGNPKKRISWDYGIVNTFNNSDPRYANPTGGYCGNLKWGITMETPTYYPAINEPTNITIRTNRLNDIKFINMRWQNPYGHLDLSKFSGLESLELYDGGTEFLTGITFTSSYRNDRTLSNVQIGTHPIKNIENNWDKGGTGLKGELDLTGVKLGGGSGYTDNTQGWFRLFNNPFLNKVKHGSSDEKFYIYSISAGLYSTTNWEHPIPEGYGYSGITGVHDVSMLSGLGGYFDMSNHPYLKNVKFPNSHNRFNIVLLPNCNLKGNLDLSGIDIGNPVEDDYTPSPLYGNHTGMFDVRNQGGKGWPIKYSYELTGITHSPNTSNINTYWCGNTGVRSLDLSMLRLGTPEHKLFSGAYDGSFQANACKYLTGITHTYTNLYLRNYWINSCDELVEHDMTMIPNLCGYFTAASSGKLKKLTHTACTSTFPLTYYNISNTAIEGNHDMSHFPKLGGQLYAWRCYNLTGLTFTNTSELFTHFHVYQSSLSDELVLTGLTSLGGDFRVEYNKGDYYDNIPPWPNYRKIGLRKITHGESDKNFNKYHAYYCALEGELDVSMLKGLGGDFNVSHNYSGFTNFYGNLQNIKFPSNNRPISINAAKCNLQNNLDVSMMSGMTYLNVSHNVNLSGITIQDNHKYPLTIVAHYKTGHNTPTTPLKSWGTLDVSHISGLTSLDVRYNTQLSGLTLPTSTNPMYITADAADIQPNLDLTPCGGLKYLIANHNTKLKSVSFTSSVEDIERINLSYCDLQDILDISMLDSLGVGDPLGTTFTNAGGIFDVSHNPNLTTISHPPTTNLIYNFNVGNCDIKPHLDLSNYSIGVGNAHTNQYFWGYLNISGNINLTSVTHSTSPTYIRKYECSYTGVKELDLTMLDVGCPEPTDFNGTKWESSVVSGSYTMDQGFHIMYNNSLTEVLHGNFSRRINNYSLNHNDLTGTHDISGLINLRFKIRLEHNPNLTNIIFPTSTQIFLDSSSVISNHAFQLNNCNLGYIDFSPLAGATLNHETSSPPKYSTIHLENNNMSASEVNHILDDLKTITINNSPRWNNITLIINGNNDAPDNTSGGYDGLGAINILTNSTYNWSITTT